jgi:hypothetical protein
MVRIWIRIKHSDPEPYQIEKRDPDRYQSEKQDPDPYQRGLDQQNWLEDGSCCTSTFKRLSEKVVSNAIMKFCISGFRITFRVCPAAIGDWKMEIRRWLVSTLIIF